MPALKCEICHGTEAVVEAVPLRQRSYLCSLCIEAIVQLGNTTESLIRVAKYLDGEEING